MKTLRQGNNTRETMHVQEVKTILDFKILNNSPGFLTQSGFDKVI